MNAVRSDEDPPRMVRKAGAKFELGRVVMTSGAESRAEKHGIHPATLLRRHISGDWGDLDAHDRRVNDQAVKNGSRILSVYGEGDTRLYVITDAVTDACPKCHAGTGICERDKGEWHQGFHFRTDLPPRRLTTTILRPEDY